MWHSEDYSQIVAVSVLVYGICLLYYKTYEEANHSSDWQKFNWKIFSTKYINIMFKTGAVKYDGECCN